MIPVTYIQRNATSLTSRFNKSTTPLMTMLYAKLVIIEVGGWVEMSMDDLVERAAKRLKVPANITHVNKEVIRRNYGFDYEANFRPMLMKVIGIVRIEALENRLDTAKFTKLKAALVLLKQARNTVAHTYIKNPTGGIVIPAPSVAISYLRDIHDGLKDFEKKLKALKLV